MAWPLQFSWKTQNPGLLGAVPGRGRHEGPYPGLSPLPALRWCLNLGFFWGRGLGVGFERSGLRSPRSLLARTGGHGRTPACGAMAQPNPAAGWYGPRLYRRPPNGIRPFPRVLWELVRWEQGEPRSGPGSGPAGRAAGSCRPGLPSRSPVPLSELKRSLPPARQW